MASKLASKINLVEYGDFECPNCLEAYPIVKKIQKKLGSKLNFEFKYFPITESHPHALNAAKAAESAKLQGKFWEMHDTLFENQENLEDDYLVAYAKKIHLNIEKFVKDFNSKKVEEAVHKDFLEGARKGVNGTPTFFVNDKRWDGDYDYESLMEALNNE